MLGVGSEDFPFPSNSESRDSKDLENSFWRYPVYPIFLSFNSEKSNEILLTLNLSIDFY